MDQTFVLGFTWAGMTTPERGLLETVRRRAAVIERLSDTPRDKRELTDQLDVSRQTVDRALRELESAAIAERTDKKYRLTLFGTLAYREFSALLERFERLCLTRDLLVHLPTDTQFDVDVLVGAEVVYSGHPMPHEPIRELERLVEDADRLVGYSPISFPQYVSLFHRQITETDTEIELFLDVSLVTQLWESYCQQLREALSSPNFSLCQLSEPLCPNMGLVLLDESTVWIGVYDEDGNVRGAITTDADPAVAWARERLDDCRTDAREVFLRSSFER